MNAPSTGKVLRMIDAARLLGFNDPEKFRVLAERAEVKGTRGRGPGFLWSEADVAAVRRFAEENGLELGVDDTE